MTTRLTLAALLATGLAVAGVVPAANAAPTADWFWEWSDGSRAGMRVLAEDDNPDWALLPALRVASSPATAGRLVELQVRSGARWLTEDATRTDVRGTGMLHLNPYCADGAWCSGPTDYRLRVEGITASMTVRFIPRRMTP